MISIEEHGNTVSIVLEPNRSATWEQTRIFVICVAIFVFCIAIAWAIAGAWMILPFAGIEVILLAFFMHYVSKNTYQKEMLSFNDSQLTLYYSKSRRSDDQESISWQGDHLTLIVVGKNTEFDISSLFIRSVERDDVEIGHFLNQQDKEELLVRLKTFLTIQTTHTEPSVLDV